jgi:hypothetical protein
MKKALIGYKSAEQLEKEKVKAQEEAESQKRENAEQLEKDKAQEESKKQAEIEKSEQQKRLWEQQYLEERREEVEKAKRDCPEDWKIFVELEKKQGIQLWKGCGAYTRKIPELNTSGYGDEEEEF